MANDKDFKIKNGVKASAYHEAVGTVTSAVENTGPTGIFSTDLYSGGTAQQINNGIDFSTDGGLVWIKRRETTGYSHQLFDTERTDSGTDTPKRLSSDSTAGHDVYFSSGEWDWLTDGFDLNNTDANLNGSGGDYVAWSFKKESSFFDVLTYTGDGNAGRTVSHSLGSVPGCIIVKGTGSATTNWAVYHRGVASDAETDFLRLNLTSAAEDNTSYWNDTAPTSTEFTVGSGTFTNNGTYEYVAYLFGHDTSADGNIYCGSYTGNGSATGPIVNLGWEPGWLMIKRTDTGGAGYDWFMFDSERGMGGSGTGSDLYLDANSDDAEAGDSSASRFITTSTGFQLNTTSGSFNASGGNYIFIAIRKATSTNTETLDLSTGSVFEITADADVQIGLSNPAPSGTVSSATLILNLKGSGEQANLTTLGTQFVSAASSYMKGSFVGKNGSRMYVSYQDTNYPYGIFQYNILRPPYLDSAVLAGWVEVGGTTGTAPTAIFFKPDGTKMYQIDTGNDGVYQWDLSTPWEISSAVYNSKQLSIASQATTAEGLWFKTDGTSLYVLDIDTDDVYQYDLTTAWDVSTGSYASKSIAETSQRAGIIFNDDGTKIFIGRTLEEYDLSTAWDISTGTASGSTAGGSIDRYADKLTLTASGGKYFYLGNRTTRAPNRSYDPLREQKVARLYFGTPYSISYDSSIKFQRGSTRSAFNIGETRVITFTTRDGGTTYMAQEVMKGIDDDV